MKTSLVVSMPLFSSPLLADYRDGHGGWAHSHGCEKSEQSNCEPHHHVLNDIGVKIATEKVINKPFIKYANAAGLPEGADRWDMRSKLISAFIRYFNENRLELLKMVKEKDGNAVGGCLHQPPFESYQLEHSQEERDRFELGLPKPQLDPSKPKLPMPRIEDFIEEYTGNKTDKI
ncbi:MAG: hypothetical protein ACOH5I_07780 [Oligoflexus sp.]